MYLDQVSVSSMVHWIAGLSSRVLIQVGIPVDRDRPFRFVVEGERCCRIDTSVPLFHGSWPDMLDDSFIMKYLQLKGIQLSRGLSERVRLIAQRGL